MCHFSLPKDIFTNNGKIFIGSKIKDFVAKYRLNLFHSFPYYLQVNEQVKFSNKLVLNLPKKKLESKKGKWIEEILGVLWAIKTSLRGVTNETLFSLIYGIETIILIEIITLTHYEIIEKSKNNSKRYLDLLLSEELHEKLRIGVENEK